MIQELCYTGFGYQIKGWLKKRKGYDGIISSYSPTEPVQTWILILISSIY